MNIKVITRHAPSNYGSLLQAFATIKILNRLGHHTQIIDYIRPDERGLKSILTSANSKKEWNGNILKKLIYVMLRYPEEKCAELKFNYMRKQYLNLTKRCTTSEELKALQADIFMTGSDQVWGPTINGTYDTAYFLDFATRQKKVAYAASFGRTEFTPEVLKTYQKMLLNYDSIAVREKSAADLLYQMQIPCTGQVLDPTLLLTSEEWSKYIKKIFRKNMY